MMRDSTATLPSPRVRRLFALPAAALLGAALLAGCSAQPAPEAPASEAAPADDAAQHPAGALAFEDAWAPARDEMSGVFGTIVNSGAEDVELVGARSDAAGVVELHETDASGTMSRREGGLPIAAGSSVELAPGGDHIMLMELAAPLLAGDDVELTLLFSDGSELEVSALVKSTQGAQEDYSHLEEGESGDEYDDHGSHDGHGGHAGESDAGAHGSHGGHADADHEH